MKYIFWILALIISVFIVIGVSCVSRIKEIPVTYTTVGPDGPIEERIIKWHPFNQNTIEEIEKSDRCFVLYFSKKECPNCRYLEDLVFRNAKIVNTFNNDFVSIRFPNDEALHDRLGIERFPALLFALPDNEEPLLVSGRITSERLIRILNYTRFNVCN